MNATVNASGKVVVDTHPRFESIDTPQIIVGASPSDNPVLMDEHVYTERVTIEFVTLLDVPADFEEARSLADLASQQRSLREKMKSAGPFFDVDLPSDRTH